jgi:hypothetical protein
LKLRILPLGFLILSLKKKSKRCARLGNRTRARWVRGTAEPNWIKSGMEREAAGLVGGEGEGDAVGVEGGGMMTIALTEVEMVDGETEAGYCHHL